MARFISSKFGILKKKEGGMFLELPRNPSRVFALFPSNVPERAVHKSRGTDHPSLSRSPRLIERVDTNAFPLLSRKEFFLRVENSSEKLYIRFRNNLGKIRGKAYFQPRADKKEGRGRRH